MIVLPLVAAVPTRAEAGGKGRALAVMVEAGLPVPVGFIVGAGAYRAFVAANALEKKILEHLDGAPSAQAAWAIAALFGTASIPDEVQAEVRRARAEIIGSGPVAVRSSATSEDLPGASFAGQHASFLNVRSEVALIDALRRCWSSLWSERAIAYRNEMGMDHAGASMAVVVQALLEPDTSGILFTANPATSVRELVIEGSYGLGEAIVGGQVTPDAWVVDRDTLSIGPVTLGSKERMTVRAPDGGTETVAVPAGKQSEPCLSEERIRELARLGLAAEVVFDGVPQDVEWVIANGSCWLVQSRPITNLPTPPREAAWLPPPGAERLLRRQVVENMPGPLSPLFEELYLGEALDRGMDRLVTDMGLPIDVDEFIDRPLFVTVNGYGYCRYDVKIRWRTLKIVPKVLYFYVFRLPRLVSRLIPMWQEEGLPEYQEAIEGWRAVDLQSADDQRLLAGIRALALADGAYWLFTTMMVGVAKISEGLLGWLLSASVFHGQLSTGMFLAGLASKTMEAERELELVARNVSSDQALKDLVLATPVRELMAALAAHPAGSTVVADLNRYLDTYGHQVYDLDFAEPTQIEDPTPVLMSLKALVLSPASTGHRQADLAARREVLISDTRTRLWPIRRRLFDTFLGWARRFGPYREEALFHMGAAWPTLRRLALTLGERLVASGLLGAADDVFYLRRAEIEAAIAARAEGRRETRFAAQADERRVLRESRKGLHPPSRVPVDVRFRYGPFDLTRFIEIWETQKRNPDSDDVLSGFAVSPGRVTGPACLIRSPADFERMRPDSILVCPTTTPAWTPLFAQATGLVTDIGAVLAHGSIVAREYGIPAVLGCGNATRRIADGQTITVDGSEGVVIL